MWLPVMEAVVPPPSEWGSERLHRGAAGRHLDEPILAKVRALLAKAESTSFEHEADALTAKAQELMARYAIDEAVANAVGGGRKETPSLRRVPVDDPYANPKSSLLAVVSSANKLPRFTLGKQSVEKGTDDALRIALRSYGEGERQQRRAEGVAGERIFGVRESRSASFLVDDSDARAVEPDRQLVRHYQFLLLQRHLSRRHLDTILAQYLEH